MPGAPRLSSENLVVNLQSKLLVTLCHLNNPEDYTRSEGVGGTEEDSSDLKQEVANEQKPGSFKKMVFL